MRSLMAPSPTPCEPMRHRKSLTRFSVAGAVCLTLLGVATPLAAQTIGLSVLDSATVYVAPGAKLAVPLRVDLSSAGTTTLAALQGALTWSASRLTFDSLRVASSTGFSLTTNTAGASTGTVSFNALSTTALAASGPLATAYFTAGSATGGTRVTLAPTVAGSVAGANILGLLRVRQLGVCVAPIGAWGDANDDGTVNIIDAQQIARFSVGLGVANSTALAARGDVTADGTVNVIDAQQIARFSVALSAAARVNTALYTPPAAASVALTPSGSPSLLVGATVALTAEPRDAADASLAGCRPVAWTSSNSAVAAVSSVGLVTGVAPGQAVITASAGAVSVAMVVGVVIPESRLTFDRIPSQVRPGLGLGLVVRATSTGGDTLRSFSGPVTIQDESGASTLLGTATVVAQHGVAIFDDLAIATAGSYRLRASASLLSPVSSGTILVTASATLPTITVGQVQRTGLTGGVLGSSRYLIPVTLRDTAGVSVGPTPVTLAIARGSAAILSGSTMVTTVNGTATFDIVMQGTGELDLSFSAPGFQTRVQAVQSPTDDWLTFVWLGRAAADSVVSVGRLVPISVNVVNFPLSAGAVHAVTYDVSWNPAQLSLSTDTTTTGASYTINRAQTSEGVLRVTMAGATAIADVGQAPLVQRLVFTVRAGASGIQRVRVTSVSVLGPSGESLAPLRVYDISFRVP